MRSPVGLLFLAMAFLFVSVSARAGEDVVAQLKGLLTEMRMDKVQVKTVGPLIVIDGEVEIPSQLETINKIARGLREADSRIVVENLARVCPASWTIIAERIEREVGSPQITAAFVNRTLHLEGVAESDFEADRAVQIARSYLSPFGVQSVGLGKPTPDRAVSSETLKDPVQIVDMLRVRPAGEKSSPKKKLYKGK